MQIDYQPCRRLIAGGLPDRAGQPTHIMLTMTLHDLLGLPGTGRALATWDASGAPAPPGADCDAALQPIITGHLDQQVLDQLDTPPSTPPDTASPAGPVVPPRPDTAGLARRTAAQLTISRALRLLSGPGGLASWLRTSQLTGAAATISLPLDIGAATDTIPPHLRRAIIRRDQHSPAAPSPPPPATSTTSPPAPKAAPPASPTAPCSGPSTT
jgi:hypothetical protein